MKLQHRNNCVLMQFIPDNDEATGMFDEDNGHIYVKAGLGELERECIYLHELSHKECFEKKCSCWNNLVRCEWHAMRGELNKVLARGSVRLNRAYIKNTARVIAKYKTHPILWHAHIAAMQRLKKTKAFRKIKRMQ